MHTLSVMPPLSRTPLEARQGPSEPDLPFSAPGPVVCTKHHTVQTYRPSDTFTTAAEPSVPSEQKRLDEYRVRPHHYLDLFKKSFVEALDNRQIVATGVSVAGGLALAYSLGPLDLGMAMLSGASAPLVAGAVAAGASACVHLACQQEVALCEERVKCAQRQQAKAELQRLIHEPVHRLSSRHVRHIFAEHNLPDGPVNSRILIKLAQENRRTSEQAASGVLAMDRRYRQLQDECRRGYAREYKKTDKSDYQYELKRLGGGPASAVYRRRLARIERDEHKGQCYIEARQRYMRDLERATQRCTVLESHLRTHTRSLQLRQAASRWRASAHQYQEDLRVLAQARK